MEGRNASELGGLAVPVESGSGSLTLHRRFAGRNESGIANQFAARVLRVARRGTLKVAKVFAGRLQSKIFSSFALGISKKNYLIF